MKKTFLKTSALLLTGMITLSACANISEPKMSQNQHVLNQYHWHLETAIDAQQQSITSFYAGATKPKAQINFNDGRLHIYGSCNRMFGAYQILGSNIQSENLASTLMGCPAPLQQQDQAMGEFFSKQSLQYELNTQNDIPTLTLRNRNGQVLQFKGEATAETKYGTQAETIFLEISPETKTCTDGNRTMQCLQVKEVRYDEKGLKTYTSPQWQYFYDNIEGYTHRPDTHNILRVKRYTVKNPPADTSGYAYVLDLVVTTSSVK